jgi:hypothetical protein
MTLAVLRPYALVLTHNSVGDQKGKQVEILHGPATVIRISRAEA